MNLCWRAIARRSSRLQSALRQNSTTFALFSKRDCVRPDETAESDELTASLLDDLRPETTLERVLASEVVSAAWRLRRCARLESSFAQ